MGLSDAQRQRWQFHVDWCRHMLHDDECGRMAEVTLAVAAHVEELEAEVERLRAVLADWGELLGDYTVARAKDPNVRDDKMVDIDATYGDVRALLDMGELDDA